jgi:hypothetical protein
VLLAAIPTVTVNAQVRGVKSSLSGQGAVSDETDDGGGSVMLQGGDGEPVDQRQAGAGALQVPIGPATIS